MKTNSLSRLLIVGLVALFLSWAYADEEQDLLNVLQSNAGAPQKCEACQKLRLVGTVKAVPVLATLLREPATAHAARYALEGMPCSEAATAMREAAGSASGLIKAGLIDSLGWRRDVASVPLLSRSLADADAVIASAAATALGRIGDHHAAAALTAACDKAPPAVQPAVLDGLSRCADRLLAGGDAKGASAIYRKLIATKFPPSIRIAAWRGLVMADTAARPELVSQALTAQDPPLRLAALKVLRELNDPAVVEACLRNWPALPGDSQVAVIDARVRLGGDVLPTLRTATQSPQVAVRVAAWQALADSSDATMIPALAQAAGSADPAERDVARDTLTRVRGPHIQEAFLSAISAAEPKAKVELLRALGDRYETNATGTLLGNAAAGPDAVRFAALESLRKLADPNSAAPLLALAAKTKSDAENEHVLNALFAVCQSSRDKDQLTTTVLGAMKSMSPPQRGMVMPVLSELATTAALDAALAITRESDPEAVKQSVRVLSQWPNAAPAVGLFELANTAVDPSLQVLALRGCISVGAQEPDYAKRLALLQHVMAAAKRPDEKRQALGQIGQVPTREALDAAMSHLAEPDLANEAGLAAVTIAEKLAGSAPDLARETADKVLAQCSTPDIVKRAWAIRGKPAGAGPFVQDWLVCGPFTKPGLTGPLALFDVPFGPEAPDTKVQWKPLPRAKIADLSGFFPDQTSCVAYLKTHAIVPRDCDAALLLGSDDGVKAWVNGIVVLSKNVDRGLVEDQDMAPIRLNQGTNELLLKVTQGGGGWAACARIVARDGRPLKGLRLQVDR